MNNNTRDSILHLKIRYFDNDFLELIVFPGVGGSLHNRKGGVVLDYRGMSKSANRDIAPCTYEFVIFDVQIYELRPKVGTFSGFDDVTMR